MIEHLWRFVAGFPAADVPPDARHAARRAAVDFLGIAIVGSADGDVASLRTALSSEGPCSVIGVDATMAPRDAAYANSAAAHVLSVDDFSDAARGHVSAVVLPAAIAVAQALGRSDDDLVDAYAIGYETEAAIGSVISVEQYDRGWHPTATVGVFGAAAASARLWRLDADAVAAAFAIAAVFASGVRASVGTFLKPLQVGLASSQGVVAASLAAAGIRPGERSLDGEHGYPAQFNGRALPDWSPLDRLGTVWDLVDRGPRFVLEKGGPRLPLDDEQVLARFSDRTAGRTKDLTPAMREWISGGGGYVATLASLSR